MPASNNRSADTVDCIRTLKKKNMQMLCQLEGNT